MNIDKISIISLDLDGTLLNDRKQISSYSIKILTSLQEKGYIIVLNSGRFYHEMLEYATQLQLQKYGGYLSCSNGFVVHDMRANTHYEFTSISFDDAQEIIEIAASKRLMTYLHFDQAYYIIAPSFLLWASSLGKLFARIIRPICPQKYRFLLPRILELKGYTYHHKATFSHLEKICFVGLPFQLKQLQKDAARVRQDMQFFEVNPCACEFVKKGVSKADSLAYIAQLHDLTLENVIAFGDSGNDYSILSTAGIGVIMKNAKPMLKGVSPHISEESNHKDGVAKFLEKNFLSERL